MTDDLAGQVRVICLALPEVSERLSHGAPTWFVRGTTAFVTLWAQGHHAHDFPHLWCAGLPGRRPGPADRPAGRIASCTAARRYRAGPPPRSLISILISHATPSPRSF